MIVTAVQVQVVRLQVQVNENHRNTMKRETIQNVAGPDQMVIERKSRLAAEIVLPHEIEAIDGHTEEADRVRERTDAAVVVETDQ